MSRVDDLLLASPERLPRVFEAVIATTPAAIADPVYVTMVNSFDPDLRFGPCPWEPRPIPGGIRFPARGDRCLIAFSDDNEPWLISWQNNNLLADAGTIAGYDASPLGSVVSSTGTVIPEGYVLANGQSLFEPTYPQIVAWAAIEIAAGNALWSMSGVAPNRTVVVPNLADKFIYGRGAGALGATGGAATHLLTATESGLPSHSHTLTSTAARAIDQVNVRSDLAGTWVANHTTPYYITGTTAIAAAAAAAAHNNMPPYVVLAWIVKVKGVTLSAGALTGPAGPPGSAAIPFITAAPLPASPNDGDVVDFLASASKGTIWRLRYRAASASIYKWEPVGRPAPLYAVTETGQTITPVGAWGDAATIGPSVTAPLEGEYETEGAAQLLSTAALSSALIGFALGAIAPVRYAYESHESTTQFWHECVLNLVETGAIALGTEVRMRYYQTVAGWTFGGRRMNLYPKRVK